MTEFDMSKLSPIADRGKLSAVLRAVSHLKDDKDIETLVVKQSNLPIQGAVLQGIEATPDGVFAISGGNKFEAVANVFFIVNYSTTSNASSMSESLPAHIEGHFDAEDKAVIDQIKVDSQANDPG